VTEAEEISRLIGDIYDASLDPALWPPVFKEVTKYIGGSACYLFWQDMVGRNSDGYFAAGHDPHFLRLYHQTYFKLNPVFPTVMFHSIERPLSIPDCLPREEFCRTRFAVEWVAPQGYTDVIFSNVEKSATSCAVFSVLRHKTDGLANDETRRRFSLVVPHVRRALLIGKIIDLHKIEAAALADTLDMLSSGMFIVDAASRIIHANASGHGMLADADVVRAAGGRLVACDPRTGKALADIFLTAEGGDSVIGCKGIAVPLKGRNGEHYVGHVLPLTSGARRKAGVSYAATAAIFIRKATLDLLSPPEAVARRYNLTPAEIRVLFAIVAIGGVPEIAPVLGIAEQTVKSHLHHIFQKTGTRRQADLVKLVAAYSNPLSSQP